MNNKFLLAALLFVSFVPARGSSDPLICGYSTKKVLEGNLPLTCLICQQKNLNVISLRRWITFFFIPVFPFGEKKFYLECLQCENCYKLKDIDIEKLLLEQSTSQSELRN